MSGIDVPQGLRVDTPTGTFDRIEVLRQKLAGLSSGEADSAQFFSTGCSALDHLLPGNALRPGMLLELLSPQPGSGAGALAMHCAARMVDATQGCMVVTDRWRRFYPPAAVARGIETRDLIVVRSTDDRMMSGAEELWALDQALRCPGVAVVLAWLDKVDPRAFRRLQLAAEAGGTLALLLRPARVQSLPTWSDVQLLVQPRSGSADAKASGLSSRSGASPNGTSLNKPSLSKSSLSKSSQGGASLGSSGQAGGAERRRCRVTLLRQRGRSGSSTAEGTSVELEMDEMGTLKEHRHETRSLHMAPRVAYPANRCRPAGA